MASFKGISFSERGQGAQTFPRHRRKAVSSTIHTVDGNNQIQHCGRAADTLALPIRCTEAQLGSLYSAVASSGSLDYSGGTRTAFLEEVDPQEVSAGRDVFFVTLTFTLS